MSVWPLLLSKINCLELFIDTESFFPNSAKLKSHEIGRLGENFIEKLYRNSFWTIKERNFKIRGSEIDIIVANEFSSECRVIEVKARRNDDFKSLNLNDLISYNKLKAIHRGANKAISSLPNDHQKYFLTLDIALIQIGITKTKFTYWHNAFDLNLQVT